MQVVTKKVTYEEVSHVLLQLGVPAHRIGFEQLCFAIPRFAEDARQSLNGELYPYIAKTLNCSDWRAVEHSIRNTITFSWVHRDPELWSQYFLGYENAPSNKQFIATIAEFLKCK